MEERGKGEKSNDKCREWKANVTVTMNDREVNIDENCYSLTVKQVLLCDDNEEGIDEIVILRPSNRFFSVTITKKELMKIVILSQSNKFFLCGGNEEGIDENRYSSTVK